MLDLFVREGTETFRIGWGRAEEEGAGDDIVDVSIFIAEGTVEREAKELAFFIADESNGILKG